MCKIEILDFRNGIVALELFKEGNNSTEETIRIVDTITAKLVI